MNLRTHSENQEPTALLRRRAAVEGWIASLRQGEACEVCDLQRTCGIRLPRGQ